MRLKMVSHRDALAFVRERFGTEGQRQILATLSDTDREVAVNQAELIHSWVDVDVHVRLLNAVLTELADNKEALLWEMGEWIATRQLNTIYRMFLFVVSPEFMLQRSSTVFHTFYDEGAMEVERRSPGLVDCTFRGFAAAQQPIELSITGWFAGAAKLSRAREVRLDITTSLREAKGYFRVGFSYRSG
jgi:hypothetical protein